MPYAFLIAGASGMLGTAMQRVLAERAEEGAAVRYVAPPERGFDITSPADVASQVRAFADVSGRR